MEFRVLGSLEVRGAGQLLPIRGSRRRALLTTLLLHAGRVVPVESLTQAVWPDGQPNSALANIRTYVYELRRQLQLFDDTEDRLTSHPGGYRLTVGAGELDLFNFRALITAGHRVMRHGDHHGAAECFGRAVRIWRGRPAEGLEFGQSVAAMLACLEEEHWSATSAWIDAQLALGRHEQVIPMLRETAARRPLCEHTWAQLMTALGSAGRTAEALAAYQQARRVLVDEIAVEPGAELRRLHSAVLEGRSLDSAPPAPPHRAAPGAVPDTPLPPAQPVRASCDLPPRLPTLVGREDVLDELRRLGERQSASVDDQASVAVVAVSGPVGVGKTATAVAAAYGMRQLFPDAQLFATFGAMTGTPRRTGEVMVELLGALGVPQQAIPSGDYQREALYRAMIAGRRILVVLDDVADAAQVRPLIPGAGRCAVLVTSRPPLVDLDVDRRLCLSPLSNGQSLQLLAALVGRARVEAEPGAAARIAEACERLPLALRIAGGRLAAQPTSPLAAMARRLENEPGRLDELTLGDLSVSPRIAQSYRTLDPVTRSVFRRLAADGPPTVTLRTLRDRLALSEPVADRVLEELVRHHFLVPLAEASPRGGHRMPRLCRAYARVSGGPGDQRPSHHGAVMNRPVSRSRPADRAGADSGRQSW
ncbi:transcriptional regulator [Streptomyces carminius]|uniref:Transcriptional regulator n=1 Tax=Streptomyces carminius TaxID=2665496 RepID=A0A2M8LSE7_9ACTN|nr:AfsR/SARP family transcriptional regulator [Streptomyces carminius]PJE94892.1 transcriptional regulator [Streptomyces carminius]